VIKRNSSGKNQKLNGNFLRKTQFRQSGKCDLLILFKKSPNTYRKTEQGKDCTQYRFKILTYDKNIPEFACQNKCNAHENQHNSEKNLFHSKSSSKICLHDPVSVFNISYILRLVNRRQQKQQKRGCFYSPLSYAVLFKNTQRFVHYTIKISMRKNHLMEFYHTNFVNCMKCRLKIQHTYDILDIRKTVR